MRCRHFLPIVMSILDAVSAAIVAIALYFMLRLDKLQFKRKTADKLYL